MTFPPHMACEIFESSHFTLYYFIFVLFPLFKVLIIYKCLILQFFVLLPPLYELILEIERDNICGGQLLNLLHKRCHCGVPELQACIQRYVLLFLQYLVSVILFFQSLPIGVVRIKYMHKLLETNLKF